MTNHTETTSKLVKKDTLLIFTIAAFFAGFLCGVIFIVFKSSPALAPSQQQTQQPAGGGMTMEQTNNLLALEREVALHPENTTAWIEIGNSYFDSNQYEPAIKAYTKALELAPNNANVLTDLAVMYQRNGQPEVAITIFDQAIQADPRHEPSRLNKAIVLMYDLHKDTDAIKTLKDLLAINPGALGPNGMPVTEMLKTIQQHQDDSHPAQ